MSFKEIEVKNLLINTKNPRFAPVENQQSAIDTMLTDKRSSLKNLAKDIAEKGLNPGELLYVTKENKKYIVLEGNRRVTAIKLITDPQLVRNNAKNKKFFQDLNNKYIDNLSLKLNCVVFNNKKDAEHWVKQRHTGENKGIGTVAWSTEQQERYRSQVTGSPSKLVQVLDFIRKHNIRHSSKKDTIIQKVLSTPYVRKQIGIDFRKGKLILVQDEKSVVRNFEKVINKIDASNFSPRDTIDSKEKRRIWIDNVLGDQTPKKTSKAEKKEIMKKIKEQKSSISRSTLISKEFKLNISQDKINLIYKELKNLDVDQYRNAVAVLFRMFLESSVVHFMRAKNLNDQNEQQITLRKKLEIVIQYMKKSNVLTEKELKPICTANSNQNDILSIDTFNSYVHNLAHIPIANDLKIAWDNQKEFIKKLWEK